LADAGARGRVRILILRNIESLSPGLFDGREDLARLFGARDALYWAFGIALAATSVIFFSLSGYALVSRTNFNFLGGFLFVGGLVMLGGIVANIFLQMPLLSLVISGAAVLLISAAILWETSQLIHDPEANYIVVATSLLGSIWVLFKHLKRLFAFFSGED